MLFGLRESAQSAKRDVSSALASLAMSCARLSADRRAWFGYCFGSRCLGRRFRLERRYDILVKDGYNVSIVQEPDVL